ncbi:MAG: NB-ARC domain-containing protein [Bacteroidetes bacterium]|nr:NB-ARC domain-containing protein [Bacteroidota bacterium]
MTIISESEKSLIKKIKNTSLKESLTSIRKSTEAIWANDAPKIIKGFTDHGIDHCNRLIKFASQLIETKKGNPLIDEEIYLIIASIYLHDIGMQCDVCKFPDIKKKAIEYGANFNIEFNSIDSNQYSLNEQKEIRKNHQFLTAAWINYAHHNKGTALDSSIKTIPNELIEDLIDICMFHSTLDILKCKLNFEIIKQGRKQFIAAIVRLSDELDIDKYRISIETVKNFSMDSSNAFFWWIHRSMNIEIKDNNINFTISLHPDDYKSFADLIKEKHINELIEKNKTLIQILNNNDLPIIINSNSDVKEYEFSEKFPDEISKFILAMQNKNDISLQNNISESSDQNSNRIIESNEIIINILFPNPVDKDSFFKIDTILKLFENYKITVKPDYLNIKSLRNIETGYLFIFTKSVKGNILIEDEYLKSKYISINDLVANIFEETKGIIIFSNDSPNINNLITSLPISFVIEKDKYKFYNRIGNFCFSFFKQLKFENDNIVLNSLKFKFPQKTTGSFSSYKRYSNESLVSRNIDQKILTHFIGRKTDIEVIIRKIIDLEFEKEILTIKGTGGIGKTTTICKVALELAHRKIFNEVSFISCQSILSYENFEYQISKCFNLDSSVELESQISSSYNDKKKLLILDNFETILNIEECEKAINLVSFLCEYSMIVVTSRQLLNLDFETFYELRNMTSEEGTLLFKEFYKKNLNEKEEAFLRKEIIDELLNNNPLAIKLIAKGTLPSKDLSKLRDELKDDIFSNEDIEKIFEKPEDINIEKSKSLYYSIKYSYDKLSAKEKLTFEILSLFPDGIHCDNLKLFSKNKSTNTTIGNIEIKSLLDKSLLEDSNGFLKLQPIINRFSDAQFKKNKLDILEEYYTECYNYNSFFNELYNRNTDFKSSFTLRLHDNITNNYLKCLEFIDLVNDKKENLIAFIENISNVFTTTNQTKDFIKILRDKKDYFNDIKDGCLAIELIILSTIYYTKEFDQVFAAIEKLVSLKDISKYIKLDSKKEFTKINSVIYINSGSIYDCQGYSLELLKLKIKHKLYNISMEAELYRVGFLKLAYEVSNLNFNKKFFNYEISLANNLLKLDEIENYINQLYKKDTLEIIQANYTKLKLSRNNNKIDTKKFIITNPYTKGLINLMNAIQEENVEKKTFFFNEALIYLKNIKFFYLEALLMYSMFLKEHNPINSKKMLELGFKISKKYQFMYLHYNFSKELGLIKDNFDENKLYDLFDINKNEFNEYLKEYKKIRKQVPVRAAK